MEGPEAAEGVEALRRLKSTEAPLFLSPSEELAQAARVASKYFFLALKRFSSSCPLPHLVTEGLDAEQIWPQIEAQSEPSIKILRNQLRKFEKNPEEIKKQFNLVDFGEKDEEGKTERDNGFVEREIEGSEMEDDDDEGFEDEDDGEDGEEDEDEEDEDEEEEVKDEGEANGVEDKFFRIKELEKYLEEDEAREYGLKGEEKEKKKRKRGGDEEEDEDENIEEEKDEDLDEEEEEEEDDDMLGLEDLDDGEDDEENGMGKARFKDFFKKSKQKKASKFHDASDNLDMDDGYTNDNNTQKKQNFSTYEKEQIKLRSQIEQMEKANLEPKDWTMQGEVSAAKRAKNSALEVDLDFEHNVKPPPVITEEVTASLEELIQKRILEGHFDDVQKPPTLPSRAPKEKKELDENKSKKGLADVYEDEYVQKTGLVATALSFSDEQKKEVSMLFKKLCLKLDALSHFHFTPKPVIEDMSIQANVPALAMEEIAPVAVSDAAMLAPEEVFTGKGDIKEETELTQADRKRRRAKKKRKFKVESVKRMAKKTQRSVPSKQAEANEDS